MIALTLLVWVGWLSCVTLGGISPIDTRNLTALQNDIAPRCVPEPIGRGTWSLLYSCVFTLALCVWTAVHPNIPAQDEGKWRRTHIFGRRLKWVVIALFAPEVILYIAWA